MYDLANPPSRAIGFRPVDGFGCTGSGTWPAGGVYGSALLCGEGHQAGRRIWGEQAQLGLAVLEARLEHPGADPTGSCSAARSRPSPSGPG